MMISVVQHHNTTLQQPAPQQESNRVYSTYTEQQQTNQQLLSTQTSMSNQCDVVNEYMMLNARETRAESCASVDSSASDCGSKNNPNSSNNTRPNRDPLSHRIIEKRRRDRMNNCLTNLSKMIPCNYLKKGRGRIEKTEIIEMAIRYMQQLQQDCQAAAAGSRHAKTEYSKASSMMVHSSSSVVVQAPPAPPPPSVIRPVVVRSTVCDKGVATDLTSTHVHELIVKHAGARENYTSGFVDAVRAMAATPDMDDATRARLLEHMRRCIGAVPTPASNSGVVKIEQAPIDPDQPLNMSLKRTKTTASGGDVHTSQLRDLLTGDGDEKQPRCSTRPLTAVVGASSSTHVYPSSPSSTLSTTGSGACTGSTSSSPVLTSIPSASGGGGIPVFALHTSGVYYVPLTLPRSAFDSSARASLLSSSGEQCALDTASTIALPALLNSTNHHAVTIQVNFTPPTTTTTILQVPPPRAHEQNVVTSSCSSLSGCGGNVDDKCRVNSTWHCIDSTMYMAHRKHA